MTHVETVTEIVPGVWSLIHNDRQLLSELIAELQESEQICDRKGYRDVTMVVDYNNGVIEFSGTRVKTNIEPRSTTIGSHKGKNRKNK